MTASVLPPGDDLSIVSAMAGIGAALGVQAAIVLLPHRPWRAAAADGALFGSIAGSCFGVVVFIARNLI